MHAEFTTAVAIENLNELPIFQSLKADQRKIVLLVDKILLLTQSKDYVQNDRKQLKVKELEKEINQMIYKLYELTCDEVKIVDPEFEISREEYIKY